MVTDYSSDQRFAYNRELLAKEHEIEDLHEQERQLTRQIDDFNESMTRGFMKLAELTQELVEHGGQAARVAADDNQIMAQHMKQFMDDQQDRLTQAYATRYQQTELEIGMIQHQRDALPWQAPDKQTQGE
ncbi:MAG: hypothetical protein SOI66_04285 [Bifidobacterium sp.]|jgi:septal ring factor EnvC (AmiA/AmiB activator)